MGVYSAEKLGLKVRDGDMSLTAMRNGGIPGGQPDCGKIKPKGVVHLGFDKEILVVVVTEIHCVGQYGFAGQLECDPPSDMSKASGIERGDGILFGEEHILSIFVS